MVNVVSYYSSYLVAKEIADYARNRWIALHCEATSKDGRPIIVRYIREKPITIEKPGDVIDLIRRYHALKPRTFYASANIYADLSSKSKVLDYFNNVIARTPTWDIDSDLSQWMQTLEVAEAIIEALEREEVYKSVYLVWSGNGVHVHIHEKAFSPELYSKLRPLDIGYAVVEYILRRIVSKIDEVNSKGLKTPIKVENLMDPQRVFTIPLSLYKKQDLVCIAFKPDDIDHFDISWINPDKPKHNPNWRKYELGEADELAIKAYKEVGPYIIKISRRKEEKLGEDHVEVKKEVAERRSFAVPFEFRLEDLRFNPMPPPLQGGREFSKGPMEAFLKIEDILSLFAMRKITIDHAIRALNYARYAIIPFQGYPKEILEKLDQLYDAAVKQLERLRTPENVKKWLLSHGPPRKIIKRLDEFFGMG